MAVGEEPIILFRGGSAGFGDAINIGRDSYPSTLNMDCRGLGPATPSIVATRIAAEQARPVEAAFEWQDSTGNPLILMASGKSALTARVSKLVDGTYTADDDTNTPIPASRMTGAALYRHDGSSADTEMAFFCPGSGIVMRRRTLGGVYSDAASAKADLVRVIGGVMWRAVAYKVSSLVQDTDPAVESNWNVAIPVGHPAYPVNEIVSLGGSPIVLTGLGIFRYIPEPSVARFENMTDFVVPHKDNGKGGTTDGRGRVYYPTVDAGILVATFGALSQQAPLRFNWIGRDTPSGTITAFIADSHHIYAATEPLPGHVRVQSGLGLKFFKEVEGVFTDYTTVVTDQKYATSADLTDVNVAATGRVYIGTDEPFWGVRFEMANFDSTGGGFTVQYSAGTSSWTTVTARDSTLRFSRDGAIVPLPSTEIVADGSWTKGTVNGTSKYWLRIIPA